MNATEYFKVLFNREPKGNDDLNTIVAMEGFGNHVEQRYKPMESQVVKLLGVSGCMNILEVVEMIKKKH